MFDRQATYHEQVGQYEKYENLGHDIIFSFQFNI